ncbi:MAG: sulfide:quinone oxidoreductase [Solirubrobacteraceae bacterium]|jgi:sulfide:quinone oxidoreductase|nr:sulfide:quinone oxidoreductase [Solirubrobacteraceae bacterium]
MLERIAGSSVTFMTTDTHIEPLHVVIAGGGVAALETMMALRSLAGDRVRITLLAPEHDFRYRPMAVAEPFSIAHAGEIALAGICADFDAHHVRGTLACVDARGYRVVTGDGDSVPYDALVIACGARSRPAFDTGALTVDDRALGAMLRGLLQDVEEGYAHRITFVASSQALWPLPLYELALLTAERAYAMNATVEISLVTPEHAPLALFGSGISDELSRMLADAQIAFHGSSFAELAHGRLTLMPSGVTIPSGRVVAMPVLEGPQLAGVPADAHGFIPVDEYGEVRGIAGVYAAGDITSHPVKHGGISAQQADIVAAVIARRAGADAELPPLRSSFQGALMTGGATRYLEAELGDDGAYRSTVSDVCPWESSAKISALHLGPYLAHGDRYAARA